MRPGSWGALCCTLLLSIWLPWVHADGPPSTVIIYAYKDGDPTQKRNLEFFVKTAVTPNPDTEYVFVSMDGPNCNVGQMLPQWPNVKTVCRENKGMDLCAHHEVIKANPAFKQSKQVILMNASSRGPFLPQHCKFVDASSMPMLAAGCAKFSVGKVTPPVPGTPQLAVKPVVPVVKPPAPKAAPTAAKVAIAAASTAPAVATPAPVVVPAAAAVKVATAVPAAAAMPPNSDNFNVHSYLRSQLGRKGFHFNTAIPAFHSSAVGAKSQTKMRNAVVLEGAGWSGGWEDDDISVSDLERSSPQQHVQLDAQLVMAAQLEKEDEEESTVPTPQMGWTNRLYSLLDEPNVKLAGATISCQMYPHVQSWLMTVRGGDLPLLQNNVRCWESWWDAVQHGEVGLGFELIRKGHNIASMIGAYKGRDFRKNHQCNKGVSPGMHDNFCEGGDCRSITPMEVMFMKNAGSIVRDGLIDNKLFAEVETLTNRILANEIPSASAKSDSTLSFERLPKPTLVGDWGEVIW